MRKKILATLLAAVMTAASLAGCGDTGQDSSQGQESTEEQSTESQAEQNMEESGSESSDEGGGESGIALDAYAGTTLDIAVLRHTLNVGGDFNEKPAFKMAEEATGIHINWIEVESGTQTDRVNNMLNDMPDAMLGLLNENQVAMNMEAFYDLSEEGLLETYAPAVYADIMSVDGGMELLTWPDGSVRTLMTGLQVSYTNDGDGIMVINKKWLDKVEMDIPTTGEELYEVLCAFRDNDMNENGDPGDEIPMEFSESNWAAHIMNIANFFGIAGSNSNNQDAYLMVKDGKVVPTLDTEEFRAFLEYAHKLADEGLLDVEGFSQTNEQYYQKLKEHVVGCYWAWTPLSNMDAEYAKDYVVCRPVQALEGVEPVKTGRKDRMQAQRCGLAISADCENVEALLHWWNYLSSSTEMKWTVRYGEQGQRWDIKDGSVVSSTPDNVTSDFTDENYAYTYGVVDLCPMIRKDESMEVEMSDLSDATALRTDMVDQVWDMLADEYLPVRFADPDKVNERTFVENELFDGLNGINQFIADSIVSGVTDESWEAFLGNLETLQYYDWIQWYQDFYDGAF